MYNVICDKIYNYDIINFSDIDLSKYKVYKDNNKNSVLYIGYI